MAALIRPWGKMHYRMDGPTDGIPVVFANSLGTDLRLWDDVIRLMPDILAIRFDKRGHGLSDLGAEVTIADYADDAAALIEAVGPAGRQVIFVGLSIGGLIAQALSANRPDLVKAVVISNSAAKMGTAESWNTRIAAIRAGGIESIADAVMERWFAPKFRATPELSIWRNMMTHTEVEGYIAACRALAVADQTEATRALALPAMVIVGDQDGASPPDLVKATAELIEGASFHIIPDVGHLPPVEDAPAMVALLRAFIKDNTDV